MYLILNNIRIPLEQDTDNQLQMAAAEKMGVGGDDVVVVKILSKALDLKKQEQIYSVLSVVVCVSDQYTNKPGFAPYREPAESKRKKLSTSEHPIVVGFGPAGMFAALELVEHGLKPQVFERGNTIEDRAMDVQLFIRERKLNPQSNIQFGEGGAGSFSDGKLFSRRNNNTSVVNRVLKTFVRFGAPEEIEYISKPHLGTDVLCRIVRNIRKYILEQGGEIHYGAQITDLIVSRKKVSGVVVNGEREYLGSALFLGLGHSARDTFRMLHEKGVAIEQRPVSAGVRIEHPVEIINAMRYGEKYLHYPGLGAATYSLNYTNKKLRRGVYTFCMCPGGEVVNASSSEGLLVLNGMSYSRRASSYSNSALVVSSLAMDYQCKSPLAGIAFQEDIERRAFTAGGADWRAPAQNLLDFMGEGKGTNLPETSYKMGVKAADLRDLFPGFVIDELQTAFKRWASEVPTFVSMEAVLMAAETRAASPVRITRNENYQSVSHENLYPIGEGAGYAGGITSSAADGIRAVEVYAESNS